MDHIEGPGAEPPRDAGDGEVDGEGAGRDRGERDGEQERGARQEEDRGEDREDENRFVCGGVCRRQSEDAGDQKEEPQHDAGFEESVGELPREEWRGGDADEGAEARRPGGVCGRDPQATDEWITGEVEGDVVEPHADGRGEKRGHEGERDGDARGRFFGGRCGGRWNHGSWCVVRVSEELDEIDRSAPGEGFNASVPPLELHFTLWRSA